jgi:hypothetical protein
VQPAHHGLRVPARAQGDARGAAALPRDLVQGQKALAGAPVRRAHRQPAQILGRLTPAGMLDRQHDGTAYLLAAACNVPVLPQPALKTMGLKLGAV